MDVSPTLTPACRILVVDDEPSLCHMLSEVLAPRYAVDTAHGVEDSFQLLEKHSYDVVVSDLKLLDGSGIDILRKAKERDKFTEVIIITGYGTFESASEAINLGVTSYLAKPLAIAAFQQQVERAVASRMFHLRSMQLIRRSADSGALDLKEHLLDVTSLYYFASRLMVSLDLSEILRLVLEEVCDQFDAHCAAVGINYLGVSGIHARSEHGVISEMQIRSALDASWSETVAVFDRTAVLAGTVPVTIYSGRIDNGHLNETPVSFSICLPMTVLGETIGYIALDAGSDSPLSWERQRFFYVFSTLVSAAIQHACIELQTKMQAKTDSLTGVANHRSFQETLHRDLARSLRHKRCFCLALIDIDDFKKVNDTYGHQTGDAVLVDMTHRISATIRAGDLLARYGGEEFALILSETDLDGGVVITSRLCEQIADSAAAMAGAKIPYTVSIGVALFDPAERIDRDVLIRRADEALYAAKRAGKNRAVAWPPPGGEAILS